MKLINIATLIALLNVVDHSSSSSVLATTKTSEYETIPKQEDDAVVVAPLLPTLLRGAKKAVYQFLSDGDSEELSCSQEEEQCESIDDCCDVEGACENKYNAGYKCYSQGRTAHQFLSDGDSEELSCSDEIGHECNNNDDCCGDMTCEPSGDTHICWWC